MDSLITNLSVDNFRGILDLEINLAGKNLLILGENGTGKSSIVDAIEFFFTQQVEKLKGRADVNLNDCLSFANSNAPSTIKINFMGLDDPLTCIRQEKVVKPKPPAELRSFFKLASQRPFILHRSQLTQFIEARPADRYSSLSNLIGIGELDKIIDVWRKVHRELQKEVEILGEQFEQSNKQILDLTGVPINNEDDILTIINQRLHEAGVAFVETIDEIKARQLSLVKNNPRPKNFDRAGSLRSLLDQGDQFDENLESVFLNHEALFKIWQRYLGLANCVAEAPFDQLLVEGRRLFREYNLQDCPLCEQSIPDINNFNTRLDERLRNLEEFRDSRQSLIEQKNRLSRAVAQYEGNLSYLRRSIETLDIQAPPALYKLDQVLNVWRMQLEQEPTEVDVPAHWSNSEAVVLWRKQRGELFDTIKQEIRILTPSDEEQKLLELVNFLGAISEAWKAWSSVKTSVEQAKMRWQKINTAYGRLVNARREGVQKVIEELQENFLRLYDKLHPGEGHKAIQIVMLEGRSSSADLLAEMEGMQVMHPLGNYSEGHLDSLGLCIFLAFIQRFNGNLKLVILDDVLTSIDAGHRMRAAQLIAEEFKDYQIILTTHDEMWANQISTIFKNKSLLLQTIRMNPWDRERGASYDEYIRSDWAYYRQQVQQGRKQDAVAGAGRSLEKFLQTMRRNLRLAVPATLDDRYTLGDLYPAFFDWIKSHPFDKPGIPDRSLLQEEFDAYWRLRNWSGAHYNEWGASVSSEEAISFIEIVEQLVNLFECPACGSLVIYDVPNKLVRCPLCKPTAQPKVIWNYQPQWVSQARRLLSQDSQVHNKHLHAVNLSQISLNRALMDSRRRLGLSIPATPDDLYGFLQLYPPFINFLNENPRDEISNWSKCLEELTIVMDDYFESGDWRQPNTLQTQSESVVKTVSDLIGLVSCPSCSSLLNYDSGNKAYFCENCTRADKPETPGAYWYITI